MPPSIHLTPLTFRIQGLSAYIVCSPPPPGGGTAEHITGGWRRGELYRPSRPAWLNYPLEFDRVLDGRGGNRLCCLFRCRSLKNRRQLACPYEWALHVWTQCERCRKSNPVGRSPRRGGGFVSKCASTLQPQPRQQQQQHRQVSLMGNPIRPGLHAN
ncbi:hypothetical protein LZ30DRAFT_727330 [Colletotrichum cereale]|nr:hypothetical protein LZ30DRAFT_727330 [Colletotrichum cereale]